MKNVAKPFLTGILLAVLATACKAQTKPPKAVPPPAPKVPVQRVGKATVNYYAESNKTVATSQSYVSGSIDGDYRGEDSIRISSDYSAVGRPPVKPRFIDFWISFSSKGENKYVNNHQMTIYADDERIITTDPDALYSKPEGWSVNVETYSIPKMDYEVFHKLATANKVLVQIGDNKIELPSTAIASLHDLDDTIDK